MLRAMPAPYSDSPTIGSQYAMTQRVAQKDLAHTALMSGNA